MSEFKEYELNVTDLLQIPEDRFDYFLIDLKKWHSAVRNTIEILNTIAKATNQPMPKELVTLRWIDDGKHNGKLFIKTTANREDK